MRISMVAKSACVFALVFFCGTILADSVERHWEFDSANVIFARGDSVQIIGDDIGSVRVTLTESDLLPPEDTITVALNGDTLVAHLTNEAPHSKWIIRVPRSRYLTQIKLSLDIYGALQGISARSVLGSSWNAGLTMDSCVIDSLLFDSGEGACYSHASSIRQWAKIICQNPIMLQLDHPPSIALLCLTETLSLEFDSLPRGFRFEMPKENRGKCTPDRPFSCDSLVSRHGYPRNDSWSNYCMSVVNGGGSIIFVGAELCYFKFKVGGKSY